MDIGTLAGVFDRLLAAGATIIVIDHDLDLLAAAGHLIDMGQAGPEGGHIVAVGPRQPLEGKKAMSGSRINHEGERASSTSRRVLAAMPNI